MKPLPDGSSRNYSLQSVSQIKSLLAQGVPVILGLDFYYGAWNHRKSTEYGISRNTDHWAQGIIGYPEPGSVDRQISPKHQAGHSIVVVGYDDDRIVETPVLMEDGTTQMFRYKGVYYIKNSWGTAGFGAKFELNGVPHPGYGMITQKYAHEKGGFDRLF